MERHAFPLLVLLLNSALIVAAGLAGLVGMLLAGEWGIVGASVLAAILYPTALLTLHWLTWLIGIPAVLAADGGHRRLAALLDYLCGLFVTGLVLGWSALAVWWIAADRPTWAALGWGYAVVTAPLVAVVLRPFGYPLLLMLFFLAQAVYAAAWALLHYRLAAPDEVLAAIGVLGLLAPLVQFSRRWQRHTAPDY
jgi:hypothetical protein